VPYVPVVDISADPDAVGAELDEICRTVGFFQVTGHGIPDGIAERAWVVATEFFDLPLEDKLSVARPGADYPYGDMPLAGESLSQSMSGAAPADLKEVFNARGAVPDGQVPQIRHLRKKRMIAAASALAISCWKRVEVSRAASVAFLMFPHSTRTLGTVVRLSPARSSR
jgi:isopenicillin N synthase-like dioxygenase